MRNYELIYIISPELSEEGIKNLTEKINGFIQKEGGKIEKTIEPSIKKLAYPIKKKESGFLTVLDFSFAPEKLEDFEKKLKAENQIIRYLISAKMVREELPIKKFLPKTKKVFEETKRVSEPKKVELKEIDKKIEEILSE